VDDTLKEALITRFRAHLDTLDAGGQADLPADEDAGADLRSLFVELAALRSEVRTESRLVKDALDLFRGVVERNDAEREAAQREAERLRAAARERETALLGPLLIDLLEVRDRLMAGLAGPSAKPALVPWYARAFRRPVTSDAEAWREGLRMTLARFDRLLSDRGVVPLDLVGTPFDPKVARAVATVEDADRANGIVTEEIRQGFLWDGALLRAADVVVTRTTRKEEG
jgi:molecular chaperone GrpE